MASPLTAYLAGMGTLAAVLALGMSTVVMLAPASQMQKGQPATLGRGTDRVAESALVVEPPAAISPLITAMQTPAISTVFSPQSVPAPWPRTVRPSAAHEPPKLAPDPGMLQQPVRPAAPFEAAGRETVPETDGVSSEERKKAREAYAQKKRKRIADAARRAHAEGALETHRGYAQQRRDQSPLGFFGLLFGGDSR
jgi:hypothetical protein